MGISTLNGANGLQYSHARVPVLVLTHTPQLGFKDQVFFDAYLGAGYFLDFPLASNYSADEHSLDFIGHGIACKIGMSFYTALNGRFDIALLNTTAIGSIKQKNYPNYLTPPSFHTYGIQFSFHANLKSVLRKRKKNK